MQKMYAMLIGVVLVLVGVLGFVSNPLVGKDPDAIFGVNTYQNILHLVGGALMVYGGYSGAGKMSNMILGFVSAIVAVLGFIPATASLLMDIFGINMAISILHAAIGVVSLAIAYGVKE